MGADDDFLVILALDAADDEILLLVEISMF